jgi:hypothetical protein
MMTKGNKIFLSYSRSDTHFALKLIQDLKTKEIEVWIDQLNIQSGSRWDKSIEDALYFATLVFPQCLFSKA